MNYGIVVTCESTCAETTLAEMMDSIKTALPDSSQHPELAVGIWRWTFSLAREKD
jgi:hypothetical protein